MLQNINKELLLYLNWLTKYDTIKIIVWFFADTPIFFLPIFLISLWIYYTYKKNTIITTKTKWIKNLVEKENLLYIFYSVIIWITISLWIQQIVNIERPEEAIKWVWLLLLDHIPDASFPSDHATVAVAFLTSLFYWWFKKTWLYFLPFVIIMILSRIIVWVHWPMDIIAWSFVWFFSSYITYKYITKIKIIHKINKFIIKTMWYIKL